MEGIKHQLRLTQQLYLDFKKGLEQSTVENQQLRKRIKDLTTELKHSKWVFFVATQLEMLMAQLQVSQRVYLESTDHAKNCEADSKQYFEEVQESRRAYGAYLAKLHEAKWVFFCGLAIENVKASIECFSTFVSWMHRGGSKIKERSEKFNGTIGCSKMGVFLCIDDVDKRYKWSKF